MIHQKLICFQLIVVAVLLTAGCNWKGTKALDERIWMNSESAATQSWYPMPTSLRIFPGTRVQTENGQTWIDIRVELLDSMEDPIKSTGKYRFTYDLLGPQGNPTTPEPIHIWDMQVRTLEDQKLHYDRISKAYRFKLELDAASLQGRPWVKVDYVCPEGTRLVGGLELDGK